MIREVIYERMNVKIYHIAVLVGLVFGFALDCRSVGFESRVRRRLEAPRMRRVGSAAQSDASAEGYSGSVKTPVSSRNSRLNTDTSGTSSFLALLQS